MAERGAPKGNKNASTGMQARRALEVALNHEGQDKPVASAMKTLVEIWNAQIGKAREGDHQAASMIVDRLDGKAAQSLAITAEIETDLTITRVERVIVEPKEEPKT